MIAYLLQKLCVVSFLFAVVVYNINCGQQSNSQKVPMSDTIKFTGCQEKIKMKVGSILEIKLEAVPGSGYQWLVKDSSQLLLLLDGDNLKFSTQETKQPTVGQPGHQILHFKALKKGEETVKLEYKRVWESEISNSCQMKIEID